MRRVARLLLIVGVVAVVFGLSKYHARLIGHYDFTESFRFAWAIAYCGILLVVCYGLGLPDLPRSIPSGFLTSAVAAGLAALAISSVQLVVGDALLPRFVVFGSALLIVPLGTVCVGLSLIGDEASADRDRVLVVGNSDLVRELEAELGSRPERPAAIVATLSAEDAAHVKDDAYPLMDAAVWAEVTVVVLGTEAQFDERIVDQAAVLHESGVRVRTRSLFYEEWLGKIPVHELGRVALFFDIGEVHRDRYGRMKRVFDLVVGVAGVIALIVLIPFVFVGNLIGNRGPLFFRQERVGRSGKLVLDLEVPHDARQRRRAHRLDVDWRSAHHSLRPDAPDQPSRRVAANDQHRAGRSVAGRATAGAAALCRRTAREAAVLRHATHRATGAHGLGPGEVRLRR